MPNVFISGSRSLARLPEEFCRSLNRICEQGFNVLAGDSERGVDALALDYLRTWDGGAPYPQVTVFTVRSRPRVKVEDIWGLEVVPGEPGATGRALQTAKDRAMGERADWGLAYFNPIEINRFGNLQVSSGTLRNAVQLLLAAHPVKLFYTYEESARAADLSTIEDLEAVVERYQAERLGEEERAAVLAGATARDRAAGKDAAQVKFEKIAAKLHALIRDEQKRRTVQATLDLG
ncbi:hypothetical protein [uncultured Enorma sp.]|uniref:hypothetical protein n=1 Tax=uncultured Enorma sp. TaxID=1714346 RepID=UPI002803B89B|nr:hypothetical protein [uncultured Enorma sp.]